jgi:DNA methylase
MLQGRAEVVLSDPSFAYFRGRIQLIFTSPPFPLNTKKKYGNLTGEQYVRWLSGFGQLFREFLTRDGSIVIELGNSWEPGYPVMSTLALKALLAFQEENNLFLCQEFICHNPARLPSPAQWVNIDRIRLKDSYTRLWWLSPTQRPKASNRRVLKEYSPSMKELLRSGKYNAGRRPSEHSIGKTSFLKNNQGAIPPNVLTIPNTSSVEPYQLHCKNKKLELHPARMPSALAEFFIQFLTEPGDIVLDPFAGSNTTGAAAEKLQREWIAIEADSSYIEGSIGRFQRISWSA